MARTNLHELANRLLAGLNDASTNGHFEGRLREVSSEAGLNSVRSAEAIKLLEETGRIEVVQRGRRGRNTIIAVHSTDPIRLEDAEAMLPSRAAKRSSRLNYEELGRAVVDRLLELSRDDALRSAQVDAFAAQGTQFRARVDELEASLEQAARRETDLRIKLKTAEEALERGEENLRRALGGGQQGPPRSGAAPAQPRPIEDEDARAVLEILRSGRA
jgi:chromosome segregation ATPase